MRSGAGFSRTIGAEPEKQALALADKGEAPLNTLAEGCRRLIETDSGARSAASANGFRKRNFSSGPCSGHFWDQESLGMLPSN